MVLKGKNLIKEKSAGIVIFYMGRKEPLFLLLHYPQGHFDFPKGHIEKGEDPLTTALRETEEETGLKSLRIIEGFEEKIHYFYKFKETLHYKEVVYFLAESNTKEVKLSYEHKGFKWLPYKKALKTITFDNSKNILKKAFRFLKDKNILSYAYEE